MYLMTLIIEGTRIVSGQLSFLDNTKMGGSGSMIQYYGSSVVINITDIMLSCFNKTILY